MTRRTRWPPEFEQVPRRRARRYERRGFELGGGNARGQGLPAVPVAEQHDEIRPCASCEPMPVQTGCPAREPSLCGDRSPVGGQELIELRDRVAGHAPEHILQVRERIDLHPLAVRYETGEHRSRLSALVAAKEHPVAPPHRDTAPRFSFPGWLR
jgi:hypothetical protein